MSPTGPSRNMLLQLPGELRNRIFRLSLLQGQTIDLLHLQWGKDRTGYDAILIPEPALSQTCKALRPEVLSIYYGENTFNFGTGKHILSMNEIPQQLRLWTRQLRENARFLSNVNVEVNCEILGPKVEGMVFYRDFWEILQLNVWTEKDGTVRFTLRGDPSFEELCVCDVVGSEGVGGVLERASQLFFRTTELVECRECIRPKLAEVRNFKDGLICL